MRSLADFKRRIKVGAKFACIYHMEFAGRDPGTLSVIYKDNDRGIREVSIKQTNSFALKTPMTQGGYQDVWCGYPKAADCEFKDGRMTIYEEERSGKEPRRLPVLTYWFVY